MPTNRNNDEVGKSFAVDTKIEYDGKSYKVIESNSCGDCSIASICSSSDISGGIDIACTPMTFEPISARIDKNNEVILIGYLYQDRTDYKVRREYKLNNLFSDYKKNNFKNW